MKNHMDAKGTGAKKEVSIITEDGESFTVVATVIAEHSDDLLFKLGLIEIEYTDPVTGLLKRTMSLSHSGDPESISGLENLAELHEARAKALRRLAAECAR